VRVKCLVLSDLPPLRVKHGEDAVTGTSRMPPPSCLTCRKWNNLKRAPAPFGLIFQGEDTTTIYPFDLAEATSQTIASLSVTARLKLDLRGGSRTVEELAEDLGVPIEPADAPRFIALLTTTAAMLAARLLELPTTEGAPGPCGDAGDLLRINEAAKRLNVSKTWLHRRVNRLPFVVRLERGVRVSASGLERYLHARKGRQSPS
jgi:hypothetical protein